MLRILFTILFISTLNTLSAQLQVGNSKQRVNFREGPGTNYQIHHSVEKTDLLIILPRPVKNNYVEVFDVQSNTHGFIYKPLINIGDSLPPNPQKFFAKKEQNKGGNVELEIVNGTNKELFVWINQIVYNLAPYEKKILSFDNSDITYFASLKGVFPIYGKEELMTGYTYIWNFNL